MGTRPLEASEWIEIDEELVARLAQKRRLLAERPADVLAVLEGAGCACEETLALLASHLTERYPARYRREGDCVEVLADGSRHDVVRPDCALATAGLLVEEDLLLLEPAGDDYVLTAAFLCAPSHWRLADKIGRGLQDVHGPVPRYRAKLGRSVDRLFARMKADRPLWRCNWGIATSPELFQPVREPFELERCARLRAEEVAESLFVRVERQTVRRLPSTGAVLFTIKVYVDAVGCLRSQPVLAADLRSAIMGLTSEQKRYKGLDVLGPPLLAYLETITRGRVPIEQGRPVIQGDSLAGEVP